METIWLNKNPVLDLRRGRSLRRRLNSWLVSAGLRMGSSRAWGYPRHLILDLINVCGLQCPICPQGRGEMTRKPATMEPTFFRTLMDRLGPYLYTLTLTNWGEPLKHPGAVDLIRYARRFPCYIGFSTNLQHLPDDMARDLVSSGIDEIGCSIDGCTADTYNRYRVNGDFETAMANMKKLVRFRDEQKSNPPRIRWQVLLNRYTEKEIDDVIAAGKSIGVDSIVFVPIFLDIARMFTHSPRERFERDRDWLPVDSSLSWYDYDTGDLKNKTRKCPKLWDSIVVHPDGGVSPCCAVIDEKDDFGQLDGAMNFQAVWNGPAYRDARRSIRRGRPGQQNTVCNHCIRHGVIIY